MRTKKLSWAGAAQQRLGNTPGKRSLVVRKGDDAVLLEVWGGGRLLKELSVPAAVHGSVYNDGWFASGADWSADENRVAYVAEVSIRPPARA